MKAWLIALRVLAHQACRIRKLAKELELRLSILLNEQLVQLGIEGLAAAHQADQARNVVLHVERIQPRVDFGEIIASAVSATQLWIEMANPLPVCAPGSHKADGRIV